MTSGETEPGGRAEMAGMGPQGGMEVTDASMAPEVTLPRSPYHLVMAWQDEGWGMALILIGGQPPGPPQCSWDDMPVGRSPGSGWTLTSGDRTLRMGVSSGHWPTQETLSRRLGLYLEDT